MIPIIAAVSFQKILGTGRTRPCVFICEDEHGKEIGEFVVKFRSNLETGSAGLLRELLASLLAKYIGLNVPDPVIVKLDEQLVGTVVDQSVVESVQKSVGLNFGSKYVSGGYITWPVGKSLPDSIRQKALDAFVFDMFIQNPDRRISKPNLLWKNDELFLIDHEMGFSFLLDILPQKEAWKLTHLGFIKEHVFYNELKHSEQLEFSKYEVAINNINDQLWEDLAEQIPDEWIDNNMDKIKSHIYNIRDNLGAFLDEVRRVLI